MSIHSVLDVCESTADKNLRICVIVLEYNQAIPIKPLKFDLNHSFFSTVPVNSSSLEI